MLAFLISLMLASTTPSSILTIPIVHAEELTKEWTVIEMQTLAEDIARKHGLNVYRFKKTIECESQWNRFAVGDQGRSHGLAQFYYPTRDWGIATSSAYDPEIALEIMASAWRRGEHRRWVCWSLLFGQGRSG